MAVLLEVQKALTLAGVVGWQREIAEALGSAMDDAPNAATAKELKTLMLELTGDQSVAEVDLGDDLAAQRAARIARATGS